MRRASPVLFRRQGHGKHRRPGNGGEIATDIVPSPDIPSANVPPEPISTSQVDSSTLSTSSVPIKPTTSAAPVVAATSITRQAISAKPVSSSSFAPTDPVEAPPEPTSAPTAGNSTSNTGAIFGGIVGALIALGGLYFAVMFFVRRRRRRRQDEDGFGEDLFKRSTDDPRSIPDNHDVANIEWKGTSDPHARERPYDTGNYVSYDGVAYGQSPTANPFDTTHVIPQEPAVMYFAPHGQSPVATLAVPSHNAFGPHGADLNRSNSLDPSNPVHHVDLSRSSISPYQAAQYAEISRRLCTEPPKPLPPNPGPARPGEIGSPIADPFA